MKTFIRRIYNIKQRKCFFCRWRYEPESVPVLVSVNLEESLEIRQTPFYAVALEFERT